jgi:predicted transcriptional regulator|tara:strand:+ start:31 stop:270 length:240 start_codon:yes stop_codon:yes gene_type:complete
MPEKLTPKNNSEHFIELANKRVPKALKALELVGNLANKSNYTYSKSQSDQIKKALREKMNEVFKKFDSNSNEEKIFKLR